MDLKTESGHTTHFLTPILSDQERAIVKRLTREEAHQYLAGVAFKDTLADSQSGGYNWVCTLSEDFDSNTIAETIDGLVNVSTAVSIGARDGRDYLREMDGPIRAQSIMARYTMQVEQGVTA